MTHDGVFSFKFIQAGICTFDRNQQCAYGSVSYLFGQLYLARGSGIQASGNNFNLMSSWRFLRWCVYSFNNQFANAIPPRFRKCLILFVLWCVLFLTSMVILNTFIYTMQFWEFFDSLSMITIYKHISVFPKFVGFQML